MIPKIIHYCWLSDEPIPTKYKNYIDGWKKLMPDYTFKKWDKKAFDIHSVKWVEEAYTHRKWAFAADYIRVYALYTEGGFYLDSDVHVAKRFDEYLKAGFLSSVECDHRCRLASIKGNTIGEFPKKGIGIQAAIIGSEKGHPFPKELLDYYHSHSFIKDNGVLAQLPAPVIYAIMLEKRGFRYIDKKQNLNDDIIIYDSTVFAGIQTCIFKSAAIHVCAGSWVTKRKQNKIVKRIKDNLLVRKLYNIFCFHFL